MGRGKVYKWFWWGNLRERDHFEDPGIDGKKILRWIFRNWGCEEIDWMEQAQNTERWRALVSKVMNIRYP
jgi:hypothetical protein